MKTKLHNLHRCAALLLAAHLAPPAVASSHMDAPLITLDPAANTTDVYAFVRMAAGQKVLVTALGVYPHQEPGIGPNKYNFDDNALSNSLPSATMWQPEERPELRIQFQTKFKIRIRFCNRISA
jgi:hypothetical protein